MTAPTTFYQSEQGTLYQCDSLTWLGTVESDSVDLIFADPPYNVSKAKWDNFESQEH